MSEPILIALVQLFAIVAASRHQQLSKNTRNIIETYLNQYLSTKELEEYLLLYDELFSFHTMTEEPFEWASKTTLDKMLQIGKNVNKRLQQKDKIVVFIKFLEFIETIKKESKVNEATDSKLEFEYYKIIKLVFNLPDQDYHTICNFILNPASDELNQANILVISCDEDILLSNYKKLRRERLDGYILVLYLKSVDLFIGRYMGVDDLYLNGHYISANQSFIISTGSIIKNQKIVPVYFADIAQKMLYLQTNVKINLTADNIGFTFKDGDNGIKPFSFSAESGQLIGVIGGSGAGKSTLFSLLTGNFPLSQGEILINGHSLETQYEKLQPILGFIPQDDFLIEELTVFQNLYFNAKLCYSQLSPFRLTRLVLNVLRNIDLIDTKNLQVGSPLKKIISGGQRKRLNIALELIRRPYILFADEPTSGLSSMDSEMVMLLLKGQTLKGRLVMVNIHQPSTIIFKLFDKLLFLDKGGYPIYYGNPIDALTYFKTASNYVNPNESECLSCGYVNPEQLFQITESKTINKHGHVTDQRIHAPSDWYNLFKKNLQTTPIEKPIKSDIPANTIKIPNKAKQFNIFGLRNLLIKLTNKQYILLNLLEAPVLAFILAYLTKYSTVEPYTFGENKNLIAFQFMSIVVALFLGMMVSAEEIIKDKKILKREAFLKLSRNSYLNSKILFLFGLSAIQSLLYVLVGNLILDIPGMFFPYWLILFSTSCFANLIGLNLSAGFNSVVNIYIAIPFILVPQLLLSGVFVPFDSLNRKIASDQEVPFIGDIMASRWAFEALAVTQFTQNEYSKHFFQYDQDLANYAYYSGYLIPSLKSQVDECHWNIHTNNRKTKPKLYLKLVSKEARRLCRKVGFDDTDLLSKLTFENLNEESRLQVNHYLDSLVSIYNFMHRKKFEERDAAYDALGNEIGNDGILKLKQKTYNEPLATWVLNKNSTEKILVSKNGFIRKESPGYMVPKNKMGRAHFFAPIKLLGNWQINTLWFNLMAIWFMTIVLYLTLWHDSLRKTMTYFENLHLKK